MEDKIIKETKYFTTYLRPDGSTYQVFKRQPVELNINLERYTQPTDKTTVAPKINPKVKDNAKNVSEEHKRNLLATGEYVEYNGLLVHVPRNNTVITADTRTDWQRKKSQEDYLNYLRWEEHRKQKELETKVGLGLGLGTGVALALATPAAPAVNMALTAYSAGSLANLYLDGTLGFNLETGMNTLGLIPGLQTLKAATIPIWAPIVTKTANALQMVPKWKILPFKYSIGAIHNSLETPYITTTQKPGPILLQLIQEGIPYRGDHLLLQTSRLHNGGFKKLKINPNDKIEIIPDKDNPINPLLDNENKVTISTYLSKQSDPKFRFQNLSNPEGFGYDFVHKYIIEPHPSVLSPEYAAIQKNFPNHIIAHEILHAVDDISRRGFINLKEGIPPGVNLSKLPTEHQEYFSIASGEEFLARLALIKNFLGIKKANTPVTLDMWEYAKNNFVKLTGFDNEMSYFFDAVVDPKAFLRWGNPRVAGIAIPTAITAKAINNNENDKVVSNKKGSKLIPKHYFGSIINTNIYGQNPLVSNQNTRLTLDEAAKALNAWDIQEDLGKAEFRDQASSNLQSFFNHYSKNYPTHFNNKNFNTLYGVSLFYDRYTEPRTNNALGSIIYNNLTDGWNEDMISAAMGNSYVETGGWNKLVQVSSKGTEGPAKGLFMMEPAERDRYKKWLAANNLKGTHADEVNYVQYLFDTQSANLVTPWSNLDNPAALLVINKVRKDRKLKPFRNGNEVRAFIKTLKSAEEAKQYNVRSAWQHQDYTTEQAWRDWYKGDLKAKTKAFEALFERAGLPHMDRRYYLSYLIKNNRSMFNKSK